LRDPAFLLPGDRAAG